MIKPVLFASLFCWALSSVAQSNDAAQASPQYSTNTFYALLVAEIAGQRQLYDVALGNYLLESHRTQDPGVTARATQIAQFIGADQAALDAATLWVKLDTQNPLAQQALSIELAKASRFNEASLHLQKALDLEPLLNVHFLSAQGETMSEGSRESWLESLTPIVARYKTNPALLFNIAHLMQQQKDTTQALDLVDTLLELHEDFYPAWAFKARLQASQGQADDAIDTLNTALIRFKQDPSLMLLKARLYIKNKNIQQASDAFLQLHKNDRHNPQILLPLALTQLELQQYDDAKLSLEKLLSLGQMQNEAHYYLARIAQHNDNDAAALNHYLAMTSGREYLAAQGAIVSIYMKQENAEQALKHIRQQPLLDSENQAAYFLIEADILNHIKQFDDVFNVLSNALKSHSDNPELRYARAMAAEKIGKLDQLEKDLKHIIRLDPNNANALNALGYTLADNDMRLDEAKTLIKKALVLSPKDPAILDSLGWLYFRMGKLEQSLELLQQAFSLFPDAEVAAHLGEVLWVMNDKQEAKNIWRKGLENAPDNTILKDTLLRLDVEL